MLTIGLGAVFRSFASIAWGSEIYTLPSPFSGRQATLGGLKGVEEYLSIILLCAVLYAFFTFSKLGNAVQAALQNRLAAYSKGIPVKLVFWLILAIAVGVVAIAVSRVPVWRIVPILLIEQNARKALQVAARGYVLETGNIVKQGSAAALLSDDDVRKAYLGED